MDINANLSEMRQLATNLILAADQDTLEGLGVSDERAQAKRQEWGERLAELVQAMDGWLSSGGFLPQEWERG